MCLPAQEGAQTIKHTNPTTHIKTLADEVAGLPQKSTGDLKRQWQARFGIEAPRRISRDLLIRAVAYRMPEHALGGLKPSTRRWLAKVAADAAARRPIAATAQRTLLTGTVLLREWRGAEHQVVVREDDVVFQDKTYQLLSAVARQITGARWSGPRFLGLTQRRRQAHGIV